jgi:protein-tyrosine phosphatase
MHKRFVAALLLAVSAIAYADVTEPVRSQTGPNSYKISFSLTGDSHSVSVSANVDPSGNT